MNQSGVKTVSKYDDFRGRIPKLEEQVVFPVLKCFEKVDKKIVL